MKLILGMDLQFEWDQVTAFVRQPDGSLFSWLERYNCFRHLIYGIVSFILYLLVGNYLWHATVLYLIWHCD